MGEKGDEKTVYMSNQIKKEQRVQGEPEELLIRI
jgi:hypothetical protein